jgi:sulfite exporter TauE/SafE
MTDVVWAFLTGAAGSLHCLGMCGPLVVTYSLYLRTGVAVLSQTAPTTNAARNLLFHHAAFQGGRITAYALTGGVTAGLFQLAGASSFSFPLRAGLSTFAGLFMVAFGVVILGVFRSRRKRPSVLASKIPFFLRSTIAGLLRSQGQSAKGALGFCTGFLPCMLSWAMVARAAATGNAVAGIAIMAAFGLGTAPMLLFAGFFASFFSAKLRIAGERIAAVSVIIMGFILLWKGVSKLV